MQKQGETVRILNRRASLVCLESERIKNDVGTYVPAFPTLQLSPGVNLLSVDHLAAIKRHKGSADLFGEDGCLQVVETGNPMLGGNYRENLDGVSVTNALGLVSATKDPTMLRNWRRAEKRAGVIKAIATRLQSVAAEPDGD